MCRSEGSYRFRCGHKESSTFKVQPLKIRICCEQSEYISSIFSILYCFNIFSLLQILAVFSVARCVFEYRLLLSSHCWSNRKVKNIKSAYLLLFLRAGMFGRRCPHNMVRSVVSRNYLRLLGGELSYPDSRRVISKSLDTVFIPQIKILG